MPYRIIKSKEIEKDGSKRLNTLEDEGLIPSAMLQIKEISGEGDEEESEEDDE